MEEAGRSDAAVGGGRGGGGVARRDAGRRPTRGKARVQRIDLYDRSPLRVGWRLVKGHLRTSLRVLLESRATLCSSALRTIDRPTRASTGNVYRSYERRKTPNTAAFCQHRRPRWRGRKRGRRRRTPDERTQTQRARTPRRLRKRRRKRWPELAASQDFAYATRAFRRVADLSDFCGQRSFDRAGRARTRVETTSLIPPLETL